MKIVAEKDRLGMYFIEWEDGSRSESFYNLTRATELLRRLQAGESEDTIRIGYSIHDYDAPHVSVEAH